MSAEPERRESFGRAAARIAVPAALQSMLQASFGAIDQLMIGQLGSVSVAGVGLAGKLGSAASVVVAAVAGVAGVMMAQALGRGDRPEARRGFALGLAASLTVAGAAAAAGAAAGEAATATGTAAETAMLGLRTTILVPASSTVISPMPASSTIFTSSRICAIST